MTDLFSPLTFAHGPALKNRFVLAPLTNLQSNEDGSISEAEHAWLVKRALGGFGLTMTCAAQVQPAGRGFPGQLGAFSDDHLPGLARLAAAIKSEGSVAVMQLHHAGMRSPEALIGQKPLCPSDNEEFGARAMTLAEVEQTSADFVAAAVRAQKAGFDGVEFHGAHGYLLCQFLSAEVNHRTDRYGGTLENRARLIFDIIDETRARCGAGFNIGLRLSPERFGMQLAEVREIAQRLMREGKIDYLDMSLWDVFKEPSDEAFKGRTLASYFTDLERGGVRLGAAGKIYTGAQAQQTLDLGFDFAVIGRGAIVHHDFPNRVAQKRDFAPPPLPVTAEHLRAEGTSETFVNYLRGFKGFIAA
ncbi:MAG: NADH:flavin oxidoreductase [Hyphomonadaceae bacterium]